jgi:hypothetical protein
MMELKINSISQELLQTKIESIFGDESSETRGYDSNINTLLGGIGGHCSQLASTDLASGREYPKAGFKNQDQIFVDNGRLFTRWGGAQLCVKCVW